MVVTQDEVLVIIQGVIIERELIEDELVNEDNQWVIRVGMLVPIINPISVIIDVQGRGGERKERLPSPIGNIDHLVRDGLLHRRRLINNE
jgi:hypothetical protein